MYFWKIEQLKDDIASGQLNEKDRFIYVLIYVVLSAIVMELMTLIPIENGNVWDLANSVGNVLIVSLGTIFAFKANGSANGKDFLGKYFSIGFVMAIRFLVYAIPLLAILFVYYFYAFAEEEEKPTNYIDVIPFLFWYSAMYWRICVHIKQVNS
jgi:uncharacterized membrane-anchored protein YitT (DUF2179 family)